MIIPMDAEMNGERRARKRSYGGTETETMEGTETEIREGGNRGHRRNGEAEGNNGEESTAICFLLCSSPFLYFS
jgi:hypothetical protein